MPDLGRFHLTLSTAGRPVMRGWWADPSTADRKLASWVGEFGAMPAASIALVDEATGRVIHRWPDET